MKISPRIWNLVSKMYLHCYLDSYRDVLSDLQLIEDFKNVQNFQLEKKFVLLSYDDAIKVLEEILKNKDLIEEERKREEIEHYETARFWSQIHNPHPLNPLPNDPPLTKEDSGMWRRQLKNYLLGDGLIYNERNGKLQHIDTNQSINKPDTQDPRPISKKDSPSRVFISYAREDSEAALKLYNNLKSGTNLKPWLDKEDLLPGQSWDPEIRKAIKESRYFLALFSSISVQKRGYVQKEFRRALDALEEFPEGEIFAIPVRLDNCDIPYEKFRGIERVDMFPNWDDGIMRLLRTFQVR